MTSQTGWIDHRHSADQIYMNDAKHAYEKRANTADGRYYGSGVLPDHTATFALNTVAELITHRDCHRRDLFLSRVPEKFRRPEQAHTPIKLGRKKNYWPRRPCGINFTLSVK
jgi:hypothetical protein